MGRRRSLVVTVVGAVLVLGSGACVSGATNREATEAWVERTSRSSSAASTPTTSGSTSTDASAPTTTRSTAPTTAPSTSTTLPPETTTTTAPPVTEAPASTEPEVLAAGVEGPRTQAVQQRLVDLRYDPGPVDGKFGSKTTMAVWAFQKLNGLEATGQVGADVWAAMQAAGTPPPIRSDGGPNRVEVDVGRQVLLAYRDNALVLITHISSGTGRRYCDDGNCGVAVTPRGDYHVDRRIDGWRRSHLGLLYNPLYFKGGFAIHGAPSVPNHPASHGCVRIPMHIAEYFPGLVNNGDPVYLV